MTTSLTRLRGVAYRRSRAGFTILEVLIGVLVMSIGFIGIFGMQTVAIQTNRAAYDRRMATELAETTMERIKRDALMWNVAGGWPDGTWLQRGMASPSTWTAPPSDDDGSPAFNDLALPNVADDRVPDGREAFVERNSKFCLAYRMTWIWNPDMVRIEVRVFWPRTTEGEAVFAGNCGNVLALEEDRRRRLFADVQVTSMAQRNDTTL